MRSALLPLTLAVVPALVVACRKETPPGPSAAPLAMTSAATASSASSASSAAEPARPALLAGSVSSVSRPKPSASGSAPTALTGAAKEQAERYVKALGQGRRLTTQKKFSEAIKAFSEALREVPGDARAESERGYARLQSDDLDGAERDFYAALGHNPDRSVLSAATFNLALVAQKRGNQALADELKEAARTSKKIAHNASCSGSVESNPKNIFVPGEEKELQTLRQVRSALATYAQDNSLTLATPLPTSDEEAALRTLLLGAASGPWHLVTDDHHHLLFERPGGGYFLRLGVLRMLWARCGSTSSLSVDMEGNPSLSQSFSNAYVGYMCESKSGKEGRPCDQVTGDDWAPVQSYCRGAYSENSTIILDRATGKPLLSIQETVEQPRDDSPSRLIFVTKRSDGVQLLGGACNEFVPFPKP